MGSATEFDYGEYTADRPNPREIINCQNGLLHVPTRRLLSHTPDIFTLNIAEFSYDPLATCPTWERVLHDYWPEGSGEAQLLQEMYGYSITPWTDLQKVFVVLGPGRSGKGTIGRVLTMLVGDRNVAAPSLGGLGREFGTQPLLGKTLVIVGEAGFGRNDDRGAVTNFIKTVSGEDKVTINKKNKNQWTGRLLVRFWLMCNRIPDFDDSGKALAMRMIPLQMTLSWAGHEDTMLAEKLKAEVAGIMNWALIGYDRLRTNGGKFSLPESSVEMKANVTRASSPAVSFIEDCCDVERSAFITEEDLYATYEKWCEKTGQKPFTLKRIIEDIISTDMAVIKRKRSSAGARGAESRVRGIEGIKVRGPVPRAAKVDEANPPPAKDGEIPF